VHPQGVAPSQTFVWQPGSVDTSAELSCAVLSAIRAQLGRPEEFGGILLGSYETDGEKYRTRVEAFEPFTIEHRYGIGFSLSLRDQKRLRQRVERLERGRQRPVGIFRTHHRRGLYLDQRDFELFSSEFRSPASLFLVVRADEAEGARGAVFVWEGPDIRRHASYLEFAIGEVGVHPVVRPDAAAPQPAVTVRAKPPELSAPPPPPARAPSSPAPPRVFAPALPPAPVAVAPKLPLPAAQIAAKSQKPAVSAPIHEQPLTPEGAESRPSTWVLLQVLLQWKSRVRAALPQFQPAHLRAAGLAAAGLAVLLTTFYVGRSVGLRERNEGQKSVARVAKAERRRAPSRHPMPMEPAPLPPVSATLTEPDERPIPFEVPRPDEGGNSIDAPPPNYRERSIPAVKTSVRKPKVWRGAPAAPASWASPAPTVPDPPAVAANVMPQLPKIVPPPAGPQAHPSKRVVAYIKPSQSLLRRLPVLRAFTKGSETFVPANPLEHPLPGATVAADPDGDSAVELSARIDRNGKVINVKTLQGSNALARASASALYRWKFEPARQNGEPVDSEMLVRFEFGDTTH
jgi:hypothetical protein